MTRSRAKPKTTKRAALQPNELIDVSNWQSALDLQVIKDAGIVGVIAKASEGADFVDPVYETFRARAKALDLVFGSYHYARPDTNAATADIRTVTLDARREATMYLAAAKPAEGDMIALDFEKAGPLSPSQMEFWAATFLDTVEEELGQPPMLYTYPNFWQTTVGNSAAFGAYPLWLASWGPNDGTRSPVSPLPGWSKVTLHQYTSKGTVPGYTGTLDRNYLDPTVDIASLQLGLQPTTQGDPYGPPYTLRFGEQTIATAAARSQAFTDGVYREVHARGKVSLEATRRTA